MSLKLNIGAGDVVIDGFTPIDRKFGQEAYPLDYPDNSVDEIRASHILEHFTFGEARDALAEWSRVLKPGGRLRIAVPDVDKIAKLDDPKRLFYLMGGQTDENDIHKSAYDENRLRSVMAEAGITDLNRWTSSNTDTAAHPISLNIEGVKPLPRGIVSDGKFEPFDVTRLGTEQDVKIKAHMTVPRYMASASQIQITKALKPLGIPLAISTGVFWGQCMQRAFNEMIDCDWILSIDSDSMFTAEDVSKLMHEFGQHPEADAMAALQCRRGKPFPLMTAGGARHMGLNTLDPILSTTAHFGLTLIRTESLKEVPKPWFYAQHDEQGEWGDDRLDDDIWFWHQWRLAGKTLYVAPRVPIGHLEETIAVFDEHLQPHHEYLSEWRQKHDQ